MSESKQERLVQIGTLEARAPQSGPAKSWLVPVWRDMRDRNKANADKYFKRDAKKR